ncbi:hypothetical protein E4U54_004601, partial [Claviceps lovelessii]
MAARAALPYDKPTSGARAHWDEDWILLDDVPWASEIVVAQAAFFFAAAVSRFPLPTNTPARRAEKKRNERKRNNDNDNDNDSDKDDGKDAMKPSSVLTAALLTAVVQGSPLDAGVSVN